MVEGAGGRGTRLQIWTIFESHFSHLKTARCWLAGVLTGRGRGGMLRERSVTNPEISIQLSDLNISHHFLYFRWGTDKVQWRNRERARTCLNIHTAPSISSGVIPAIALMELWHPDTMVTISQSEARAETAGPMRGLGCLVCSITLFSIRIMAAWRIMSRLAPFIMMTNAHANIRRIPSFIKLCWESGVYFIVGV